MKPVLVCLFLSILILPVSAEEDSYAEKSLKGLEQRYRSLLARMGKERLQYRKELQKEVDMAKEQWMLQAALLGNKKVQEDLPNAEPLLSANKIPNWVGVNHTDHSELKLRELPDVEEWIPNYGKSGKARREKTIKEKIVKVDTFTYSEDKVSTKRINAAKTVSPWQLTVVEQNELKENLPVYSPTRVLQFAVPQLLSKKKWWLWRKSEEDKTWLRVYRYDKSKEIVTNVLPQAESCMYKFTPELKSPGVLKADYRFIVDTELPEIKEFILKENKEGLMQISWKIVEKNLKLSGISVTVYGEDKTVLSTHASNKKSASIPVPKNHAKFISKIGIEVVDLAGNKTQKAL